LLDDVSGGSQIPIRLGGDEFAVIMPGADRRAADALAWRIWETLADAPIHETDYASIYLGVSIGTSGYPWGGSNLEEITHWADTKLYANKLERKGVANLRDGQSENTLAAVVVEVLSGALDVRDRMTHHHGRRVARTAAAVARAMSVSGDTVLEIEYAASLHDIGMVGVADSILRKAGALDEDEWREMRRHSEMGYEILRGIDFFKGAADIVYAHHERYDGTGYPRALAGDDIPLGARVFAVVDSYDAMTSRRLYRDAMSREAALREIANNSGTQFDPSVVEAFLKVIRLSPDGFYEEDVEDVGLRLKRPTRYEESEPVSATDSDAFGVPA
jgi:HD-GYP domain-containing protein (c-di-GMP phosphodiesterase class II)